VNINFWRRRGVTSRFSNQSWRGWNLCTVHSSCVVCDILGPGSSACAPKHVILAGSGACSNTAKWARNLEPNLYHFLPRAYGQWWRKHAGGL